MHSYLTRSMKQTIEEKKLRVVMPFHFRFYEFLDQSSDFFFSNTQVSYISLY
jgi:hypothetical protein